ncbi:MAG: AtpZ/AtpI family protein [Daejeonella sp.]|uniref:AtpZ/AtpI family protein n=1 Tax=Daejeonella sp. TaxID=2805397 RepID=UPI002735BC2A|nr:AtpZ/AtpI family protein [Daejeonella sp.]MDP3468281.1 AtpZ/AtpI family protein [Daejeonella sp.]
MESTESEKSKLFIQQVAEKEKRKLKALRNNKRSVWYGISMFGMIGWSVAVPTLLGTLLGLWLDKNYPQTFSWTLSFIVLGIVSGGMVAANWISKEDKEIHHSDTKDNE